MKRQIGIAALALGMTLAATGSWAQVGRDGPQGGAGMDNSSSGTINQKGMKGSNGTMHNGAMHNGAMHNGAMQNGASGNKMQNGGAGK